MHVQKRTPIIRSLLDLDFYKLTMMQLVWKLFKGVAVKYGFINRTKRVPLALYVKRSDLVREMEHVRALRLTAEERAYLESLGFFSKEFLDELSGLELAPYTISAKDGQYVITVEGTWFQSILWETFILSITNELYNRGVMKERGIDPAAAYLEGARRLRRKIKLVKEHGIGGIIEFGTRRRDSAYWQQYVVEELAAHLGHLFAGTSNVHLARILGLKPIGTFAHELFMIYAGIFGETDEGLKDSHNRVLRDWWDCYGETLSIALTDTFGTKFFFRDFTEAQARAWRGLRHDSGDPFEFGETAISFYQGLGIDPKSKTLVFSDGLDIETILALHERFAGRVGLAFGWGTNLTNDLGIETLSLVVKAIWAFGRWLVKLSDNKAKAMGPPDEVERCVRVFEYDHDYTKECVN